MSCSKTSVFAVNNTEVGIVVGVDSRLTAGSFGQRVTDSHQKLFKILPYVYVAFSGDVDVWDHVIEEIMGKGFNESSIPEIATKMAASVTEFVNRPRSLEYSIDLLVFGTVKYQIEALQLYSIKRRSHISLDHTSKKEGQVYMGGTGEMSMSKYMKKWLKENKRNSDYLVKNVDEVEILIGHVADVVKGGGIGSNWQSGGAILTVAITIHDGVIERKFVPESEGCNSNYASANVRRPSPYFK